MLLHKLLKYQKTQMTSALSLPIVHPCTSKFFFSTFQNEYEAEISRMRLISALHVFINDKGKSESSWHTFLIFILAVITS